MWFEGFQEPRIIFQHLNKGQHIAQMETAMEFDAWKLLSDTKQEDDEMLG